MQRMGSGREDDEEALMPRVWVSETWRRMPSLGAVELGWLRTRLYGGRLQWGALVLSRLIGSEDLDEEHLGSGADVRLQGSEPGREHAQANGKICKILKLFYKNL